MVLYPYSNMADKLMLSMISEWHAPDPKSNFDLLFGYLPVFMVGFAFISYKKKINLFDFGLFAFFTFMFFRSGRFMNLFVISSCFYVFKYAPKFLKNTIKPPVFYVSMIIVIVMLVICCGVGVFLNIRQIANDNSTITTVLSQEAVDFVKKQKPQKLYNEYNFGGDLVFNDIKTFVDGRADIFSKNNLQDYCDIRRISVDMESIMKKYNFDGLLLYKDSTISNYIKSHDDRFEMVYEDDVVQYFINKN